VSISLPLKRCADCEEAKKLTRRARVFVCRELRGAVDSALAGDSADSEVAPLASAFDLLNLVAPAPHEQGNQPSLNSNNKKDETCTRMHPFCFDGRDQFRRLAQRPNLITERFCYLTANGGPWICIFTAFPENMVVIWEECVLKCSCIPLGLDFRALRIRIKLFFINIRCEQQCVVFVELSHVVMF